MPHRIAGLSLRQERLYRHLLATGPTSVHTLQERFGDDVHDDLYELTVRGLVHGTPLMARRPSIAMNGVLTEQEAELRRVRSYVEELDRLYDNAHHPAGGDVITVLTHREQVQHWYEDLNATAEHEIMQLITAPFLALSPPEKTGASGGPDRVNHPAKCRVICEWKVFQSQSAIKGLHHSLDRGCEIRLADRLPHKLLIGDRRMAITPRYARDHDVHPQGHDVSQMLLVHPGNLLDFLVQVFEAEWERALPLQPDPGRFTGTGVLDADEMVIVEMLAAGAHVERIASALGVHPRTVNRRLDELKRKAGVTTLYQLGAHASRHWMN
ncbi:DNA-binding CsgD family transcriptional regulator [Thermocatellispora tengchongensis]|uniref:DNA-binding CsgD family transcriptional regulator n=1 Tax=Thermocatellispora tengchongensis TaxID=1073253 RepID=A0A840PGG7_9ACTN|nr:LuxR C-terminal-related transcriptional regulator [Thermocatellispora tengchongensis]MBB5140504.1 DNA-binding CsgD family transcriptional regulator [Thermocatellispora tengchongensis]